MSTKNAATAHVDLATALAELPADHDAAVLFQHGTLMVNLHTPRGIDSQSPPTRDEAYLVARGQGLFFDGEHRRPFAPGTLLFARAGRPHRFEDFSYDLAVWVFYYGPEGGELRM